MSELRARNRELIRPGVHYAISFALFSSLAADEDDGGTSWPVVLFGFRFA